MSREFYLHVPDRPSSPPDELEARYVQPEEIDGWIADELLKCPQVEVESRILAGEQESRMFSFLANEALKSENAITRAALGAHVLNLIRNCYRDEAENELQREPAIIPFRRKA